MPIVGVELWACIGEFSIPVKKNGASIQSTWSIFEANSIHSEGRPAYLISAPAGIAPEEPGDKMYTEMLAVMKQHYCLKTAVVNEKFIALTATTTKG